MARDKEVKEATVGEGIIKRTKIYESPLNDAWIKGQSVDAKQLR